MKEVDNNPNKTGMEDKGQSSMSPQFLAVMRLNAMSRGMKWIDTYNFSNTSFKG